ncbi:MAG: hypothetical protein KC800_19370 [Candidatus Eremiobacteraeota bacterium]|nr:hypothetical protein [Candidatus Eremiobacteraeota bacterium]
MESSLPAEMESAHRQGQDSECLIDNGEDLSQTRVKEQYRNLKGRVEEYRAIMLEKIASGSPEVEVEKAQPDRVVCPGVVIRGKSKRHILNLSRDGRRRIITLDEKGRLEADLGTARLEFSEGAEGAFLSVYGSFESEFFHECKSGYITVSTKAQKEIA